MGATRSEAGRTCLGCRRRRPRGALIRIVRGPGGEAVFDPEGRLPGRGAWVCPDGACLDALSASSVAHVLRGPVALPAPALRRAQLARTLERRVGNLLGMARKTRALVAGPTGVRAAIKDGRAALLLLAADQPADAIASWGEQAGAIPVRAAFGSDALGELAGRAPFGAAAVCNPGLAAAIRGVIDHWQAISQGSCDNTKSLDGCGNSDRRAVAPRREEATGR